MPQTRAGAAVEGQAERSLRLEPPARKARHLVASGLSVPAGKFGDLPRICDK